MNSALKPVLTSSTPQNPPATTQLTKPMHPQGTPSNYGQPSTHMPQSLVNLPHNPTMGHGHPNPAHQTNHYSLNVPNASQHYNPNNPSTIPASNHPVPNVSQGAQYSPNKAASFAGGYQPNLGHPPNNPMPPVSQTLPATQPTPQAEASLDKPQSNGTAEAKSPTKPEHQENHVSSPKEKSPAPSSSPKACERTEEPKPEADDKHESAKEDESLDSKNSPGEDTAESAQDAVDDLAQSKSEDAESADTNSRESQSDAGESETTTEPSPKIKEKEQKAASSAKTSPKALRKSKTPKLEGDSPKTPKAESKTTQKSPSVGAKSKRTRTKTQPYQSPLPEIEIITKITSSTPRSKATDDKLIVFYKNEFLAVRNSEGSFYICQAVQNIYKSSPKIRIRWLSQDKTEKSGEVYTPDFYDNTDFDCILTNLNLVRVDKGRYRLPPAEKERTDSILKRSLAVEKGEVTSPSLTEEHPDGIDVSLYKEESQLKKRKAPKRKASSPLRARKTSNSPTKSPDQAKARNVVLKTGRKGAVRRTGASPAASSSKAKKAVEVQKTAASTSRTDRARRRSDNQNHSKVSPVVDQKKARVLAKVARKGAASPAKNPPAKKAAPRGAKAQKAAPKATAKKAKRSRK